MVRDDILRNELARAEYAALTADQAATRLAEPVDGTAGAIDLDWLESAIIEADALAAVEAAASAPGTLPRLVNAATDAGARRAARQVWAMLRSPRQHQIIDVSRRTAVWEQGLAFLVAAGVIPDAVRDAVTAKLRLTRAEVLGLDGVTAEDVARIRRWVAEGSI